LIRKRGALRRKKREDEGTAAIYIYLMRVNLARVGALNSCTLSMNLKKEKRNHGLYQNIHYPR
jgi:hypothetical protein